MWMNKLKSSLSSIRENVAQAYEENFGDPQSVQGSSRRNLSLSPSFSSSGMGIIEFSYKGTTRYVKILSQIAEGGYSTVFLGQEAESTHVSSRGADSGSGDGRSSSNSKNATRYAVKRIACGGTEQLVEAKKEVDVMERLAHSNVLPLLGFTRARASRPGDVDYVYMLFELYDGNLWDVVQSRIQVGRHLSNDEIGSIFRQLCLGLDALHSAGMSHRDVKPHNILLNNSCDYPYGKWSDISGSPAVLMDFGSVTEERVVISDRKSALQTQENAERYSSAPYRAPELWDVPSSCIIDGKADVWAAGCVLYYMMVGETPFERTSNQAGGSLMLSVLNGSFTWPEGNPISKKYARIVEACLSVDPDLRPSVRDVLGMISDKNSTEGNNGQTVIAEDTFPPRQQVLPREVLGEAVPARGQVYPQPKKLMRHPT
jgi:serine/threonine kinase 16